jgi:hypothetical protein
MTNASLRSEFFKRLNAMTSIDRVEFNSLQRSWIILSSEPAKAWRFAATYRIPIRRHLVSGFFLPAVRK